MTNNCKDADQNSENDQEDNGFSLPKMFAEAYYHSLQKVQEKDTDISQTFISLQMMTHYALRNLTALFILNTTNLKEEVLAEAEEVGKNTAEFTEEELKHHFERIFNKYEKISALESKQIHSIFERLDTPNDD